MQNGQIGVIIVIASLFFSVGGGFLFNTKDVTACGTEFDYVTDITGAFTGTQGNIEIEHNPAENISGYSVINPTSTDFKTGTIPGISYTTTNPNGYGVKRLSGDSTTQPLTISYANSVVTYDFGSGTSPTSTISNYWGANSEWVKTVMYVGSTKYIGVVGVTVYDLITAYQTWADLNSINAGQIRIYFDNSIDDYPGIITNLNWNNQEVAYLRYEFQVEYDVLSNDVSVNPLNGLVYIDGVSYPWKETYLVWGTSGSSSANMTMQIGSQVSMEYINPLNGVKPTSVTVNDAAQEGSINNATHLSGSWIVSASLTHAFSNHFTYKSAQDSEWTSLFDLGIAHYAGYPFNYDYFVGGGENLYTGQQENDLYVYWDWNSDDPTIVKVWLHNSTMPANAKTVLLNNVPPNGIYEISLDIVPVGQMSDIADIPSTITNLSDTPTSTTTHTGGGEYSKVTTYTTPLQVTYTTTYWSNSVENTLISIVFQRPSTVTDNIFFVNYKLLDGTYLLEPVRLKYDSGWYFYDTPSNAVNLGNWPAMMLTIRVADGQHNYVLTPIQSFSNFQSMTPMNREYTYVSSASNPVSNPQYESITYMQFNNTDQPYPYQEVIRTTIFLEDGGLYLNNGWFSPAISFPNDKIIQFRIMSAARAGESVTISTDPPRVEHDGDPIEIDGSQTYTYHVVINGYLPGGEFAIDNSIPGISIGTMVIGGIPKLYISGQATTNGVYYVNVMQYNYPDPDTEITLQFIVTGAENPSPTSRTFQTDSLGSGLYIDGTLYPWGQIYFYYVSEDAPTVSIEGVSYPGGLYMFNTFLDKGHLYLIAGKNNHTIDLGGTTNAWSIQLNGMWAVSTAYYTGENVATSVVVWDQPGTWQWDMNLLIIVFMAVNIIGLVICVRFTELSLWDWVIPICACVVAFIMLG